MAIEPTRVKRNLKANKGRIIRVEQLVGRLERRIEALEKQNAALKTRMGKQPPPPTPTKIAALEKQNANLKAEIAKLRGRVAQNASDTKKIGADVSRLAGLREPIQALVRGFKETPGAPFSAWRVWMLSTFRKQGLYRRQMFK